MQVLHLHNLHDAALLADGFAAAARLGVLGHPFLLMHPNVCLIDVLEMLLEGAVLLRISMGLLALGALVSWWIG